MELLAERGAKRVKKAAQVVNRCLDFFELVLPICVFCVLFVTFIVATFSRYILNKPLGWATDIEIGCYIWAVLLSASYVMRKNRHVRFTIVYDLLNEKTKWVFRIISNLMIIVPFCFLVKPTWLYLARLRTISPALKLPLKYYYAPILWFIISVILYALRDLIADILLVVKDKNGQLSENEEGTR